MSLFEHLQANCINLILVNYQLNFNIFMVFVSVSFESKYLPMRNFWKQLFGIIYFGYYTFMQFFIVLNYNSIKPYRNNSKINVLLLRLRYTQPYNAHAHNRGFSRSTCLQVLLSLTQVKWSMTPPAQMEWMDLA